jgi:hypothetical protein
VRSAQTAIRQCRLRCSSGGAFMTPIMRDSR